MFLLDTRVFLLDTRKYHFAKHEKCSLSRIHEEFLLLYDLNKSKNLELPYDEHDKFDLGILCEDECRAEFRLKSKTSVVWQKAVS